MTENSVIVNFLGKKDYAITWQAMQEFTHQRHAETIDEIWILEHPPIFTQGQNGKPEHILNPGNIPVIKVDRGGQVTYHGPGQLVVYTLIDIQRKKWNVRQLVNHLEHSIVDLLVEEYQLPATTQCKAPGVYIDKSKICSIGLRIRRGSAFHGFALNVQMDLDPFSRINPCGFPHLKMTQLSQFFISVDIETVAQKLVGYLMHHLGYTHFTKHTTLSA